MPRSSRKSGNRAKLAAVSTKRFREGSFDARKYLSLVDLVKSAAVHITPESYVKGKRHHASFYVVLLF